MKHITGTGRGDWRSRTYSKGPGVAWAIAASTALFGVSDGGTAPRGAGIRRERRYGCPIGDGIRGSAKRIARGPRRGSSPQPAAGLSALGNHHDDRRAAHRLLGAGVVRRVACVRRRTRWAPVAARVGRMRGRDRRRFSLQIHGAAARPRPDLVCHPESCGRARRREVANGRRCGGGSNTTIAGRDLEHAARRRRSVPPVRISGNRRRRPSRNGCPRSPTVHCGRRPSCSANWVSSARRWRCLA